MWRSWHDCSTWLQKQIHSIWRHTPPDKAKASTKLRYIVSDTNTDMVNKLHSNVYCNNITICSCAATCKGPLCPQPCGLHAWRPCFIEHTLTRLCALLCHYTSHWYRCEVGAVCTAYACVLSETYCKGQSSEDFADSGASDVIWFAGD